MSPYMLQALLAGTVHFSLSPLSLSKLVTGVGTLLLDTVHVNTEVLLTALQGN